MANSIERRAKSEQLAILVSVPEIECVFSNCELVYADLQLNALAKHESRMVSTVHAWMHVWRWDCVKCARKWLFQILFTLPKGVAFYLELADCGGRCHYVRLAQTLSILVSIFFRLFSSRCKCQKFLVYVASFFFQLVLFTLYHAICTATERKSLLHIFAPQLNDCRVR